jgi:hypothetical protein
MAVGSKDGRLSVIQISENLSSVTKNDKAALTSVSSKDDSKCNPNKMCPNFKPNKLLTVDGTRNSTRKNFRATD